MIARLLLGCALLACGVAAARPLVIESNERLPFLTGWVALHENTLLAVVRGFEGTWPDTVYTYSANLYTLNASGEWVFDQTLAVESGSQDVQRSRVALNANIAAAGMPSGLRVFERTASGWTETPV